MKICEPHRLADDLFIGHGNEFLCTYKTSLVVCCTLQQWIGRPLASEWRSKEQCARENESFPRTRNKSINVFIVARNYAHWSQCIFYYCKCPAKWTPISSSFRPWPYFPPGQPLSKSPLYYYFRYRWKTTVEGRRRIKQSQDIKYIFNHW